MSNKIKVLAFYLPQYHEIKENNEWWGEGFTDWVNVKKATPLFKGHRQPRVPLNMNYYDLSSVEAIRQQADLANEYGIEGFCIYHYWFGGKLLLEKPAELILKNPDINIRYCFSWANEPWARTWDGKNKDILIAQSYGSEDDWKEHYRYFSQFFHDNRYIRIENRPMLAIYRWESITNIEEMIACWNQMAVDDGFDGIHLVSTIRNRSKINTTLFQAHIEFEPSRSLENIPGLQLFYERIRRRIVNGINLICGTHLLTNTKKDFSKIAQNSLMIQSPPNTYGGIFVGWDNTPRKGYKGIVISEPTTEELKEYLIGKINWTLNHTKENESYVFINAWNEWAEGTYLEPDDYNKFNYLTTIKEVVDSY